MTQEERADKAEADVRLLVQSIESICRFGNICEVCGADCVSSGWGEAEDVQCGKFVYSKKLAGQTHSKLHIEADRDYWKARAEALERALRAFESSHGIFSFACFCCIYKDGTDHHKCVLLGDEVCVDMENWQFDEARFAGKEEKCSV